MAERRHQAAAMLSSIRRVLFVAPVFEDDEDKTRVSKLLNIILLSFLALTLVMMPVVAAMGGDTLTSFGALSASASESGHLHTLSVVFAVTGEA